MISVCIITRDEKEKLNRCLESLKNYPLEIVVVDTGSKDGTKELLQNWTERNDKSCTLKLDDFVWCNDFSKARNFSVSLATNDNILILDSDESIRELDLDRLNTLMNSNPYGIGRLTIYNKIEQNGVENISRDTLARLFNKNHCSFKGAIHEQIVPVVNDAHSNPSSLYYETDVSIDHDGYFGTPEALKTKSERNIKLLEAELKNTPNSPYLYYQLGKCYSLIKDFKKASEHYTKALSFNPNPENEFMFNLIESYGYALINTGQANKALELTEHYGNYQKYADFHLLMGHIYMNNYQFNKAVDEFLTATECKIANTNGANTFLAYYNAGVILECTGNIENARKLYEKCGDYTLAKARLAQM